jgi:hypothetical protein
MPLPVPEPPPAPEAGMSDPPRARRRTGPLRRARLRRKDRDRRRVLCVLLAAPAGVSWPSACGLSGVRPARVTFLLAELRGIGWVRFTSGFGGLGSYELTPYGRERAAGMVRFTTGQGEGT